MRIFKFFFMSRPLTSLVEKELKNPASHPLTQRTLDEKIDSIFKQQFGDSRWFVDSKKAAIKATIESTLKNQIQAVFSRYLDPSKKHLTSQLLKRDADKVRSLAHTYHFVKNGTNPHHVGIPNENSINPRRVDIDNEIKRFRDEKAHQFLNENNQQMRTNAVFNCAFDQSQPQK